MRDLALIAGAAVAGIVGWSGVTLLLPASLVFPVLWSTARSRLLAAGISAAYFLGASRGLPQGVESFFETGIGLGILLWVGASAAFVAIHAIFWSPGNGAIKAGGFALASFLMAVPPFGIVGWAHPVTAAGAILPGTAWVGLAVTVAGMLVLTTRLWWVSAAIFGAAWLWSSTTWSPPPTLQGWRGVDMTMGATLGRRADLDHHRALLETVRRSAQDGARTIVLPESVFGLWTPTISRFWSEQLRQDGLTVIGGAAMVDPGGYDNVLIEVDGHGSRVVYRERMPVPVSMWQPWRTWFGTSGGARAYIFANPVTTIAGKRIAPLICYEQLIVWPVLQSMLHDPAAIVAVGNGWWTSGTSIVAIQQASVEAWARLFDRPLVTAFNL